MRSTRPIWQIPVFNLLFSNGAAVWLYLFLFALCLLQRRYQWLILFLPALGIWVTLLIATPLNNEFRHAYSLFTTLPLVGILPFSRIILPNQVPECKKNLAVLPKYKFFFRPG